MTQNPYEEYVEHAKLDLPTCPVCSRLTDVHHPLACPSCVYEARTLIRDVVDEVLEAHVQHIHHSPSSSPVMVVAAAASAERTSYLRQSATSGRLCRCRRRGMTRCVSEQPWHAPTCESPCLHDSCAAARTLPVCPEAAFVYDTHQDDDLHPSTVLQRWELAWRRHLDHEPDRLLDALDGRVSTTPRIGDSAKYLLTQLTYMAQQDAGEIGALLDDLRSTRAWLQAILDTGKAKAVTGEPCRACGQAVLVRDGDLWVCRRETCRQTWDDAQYRAMLLGVALEHADVLPGDVLAETLGVKPGTLRQWAARGHVDKAGVDERGRTLYVVNQVRSRIGTERMSS